VRQPGLPGAGIRTARSRPIWRDAAIAGCKIPVARLVPKGPDPLVGQNLYPRCDTGGGPTTCRLATFSRLAVKPGGITAPRTGRRDPALLALFWPHSNAQRRHPLRIAEHHSSRSTAHEPTAQVTADLYGSECSTTAAGV
jgi:hypothetical protein